MSKYDTDRKPRKVRTKNPRLNRQVTLEKGECPITGRKEWLATKHPFRQGDYVVLGNGTVIWRVVDVSPSRVRIESNRRVSGDRFSRLCKYDQIGRLFFAPYPSVKAQL